MKISAKGDEKFEATHPLKVDSPEGKEYLATLNFLLEFALLNRIEIAQHVVECVSAVIGEEVEFEVWTNKNHNHAILDAGEYVHRKGATPAKKGELGVIPGNMRDGCYLVEGLGNPDFLNSSSHGAGRKMSRAQARKEISIERFSKSMIGITGTVEQGTIDEAPDAYKDIHTIMEAQKESVKIVKLVKPIVNWKGSSKK
jgi:tRNA-splicing ligase RtcB (3'-phosphate/5'-hydroxy nucleic acid ligase)